MLVVPTFGGKPQDEEVRVIVKDMDPRPKFHLALPGSNTVAQLYAAVSARCGYAARSFELCVVEDSLLLAPEHEDMPLSALIRDKGTTKLQLALARAPEYQGAQHDHLFERASAGGDEAGAPLVWKSNAGIGGLQVSGSYSGDASRSNFSISTATSSSAKHFTGLSNQGATCYMNSLLQSLYMTPEFRDGVYNIPVETNSDKQKDSICFQLQSLFACMQLTDKSSIETKALTQSFGWTGAEAFQQHDVQELCRVLFDELESRLKGTQKETLIKDLFQGCMESYVRNMPGGAVEFESLKSEACTHSQKSSLVSLCAAHGLGL